MKNKAYYLFFLIAIVIVFLWFSGGKQLGGGEEGLSIFNERPIFSQISLWQEAGTGYLHPIYVARVIPLFLVNLLKPLILDFFVSQALFYFVFIVSGLVGFYLLSKEIFKNSKKVELIPISASLFYFFNLYSQSQIFGRFLYSSLALWSLAPTYLFFWIKWIESAKIKWLIFSIIVSFIFSLAYLQPAHVFAFWTPPFLWVAVKIFKETKHRIRILVLSLAGVSSWAVSGLWWIYPYLRLGVSTFEEKLSAKLNLESLVSVSQYFTTKDIVLLRQSFLFGPASSLFRFYSSNWVFLASLIVLILVLVGVAKLEKNNNRLFILLTLFAGWFVSKGSNPPFGKAFFEFLFSNFSFTQSLRNPYEKFGLIFLISYSFLFGVGLSFISSKLKTSFRVPLLLILIFMSSLFLVWPTWNGDVFTKSLHVNIPSYYEEANRYLSEKNDDGRLLQLPMIGGDSVGYDWGYGGIEPGEFLFDRPSVSKILRAKYFDDKYLGLYQKFIGRKDYLKKLDEMNIKYLILHNDIVSVASGASSSAEVKQTLRKNSKIHFLKSFGELEIYDYIGNKNSSLFVVDNNEQPILDYKKLNSMHYVVNVKGAKEPSRLIFKETYSDFWEARIDGQRIEKHFLAYDYANGWEIDRKGDYNIEVIFKVWPWD